MDSWLKTGCPSVGVDALTARVEPSLLESEPDKPEFEKSCEKQKMVSWRVVPRSLVCFVLIMYIEESELII
jgi:hypothetical protein